MLRFRIFYYKFLILIALFIISLNAFSQHIIKGNVGDGETHQKLSGCKIHDIKSQKKYASDDLGNFSFEIADNGASKIVFSYVGFEDTSLMVNASTSFLHIELHRKTVEIEPFFVTATRTSKEVRDIPIRTHLLDENAIEAAPAMYADELLYSLPGVIVDRSQGIFSRNASITMRGLNSAQRVLILQDGIPLNKADGGSINWNRLMNDNIESIEVAKGPTSIIYGGSAMAGVVNIITAKPKKPFELMTKLYGGSYGTRGIDFIAGGNLMKEQKGFWWQLYSHYRAGDGYIIVPDSLRDSTYIPTKLWEYSIGAKGGYAFSSKTSITAEYSYYDDKRGEGTHIYEKDGTYSKYATHFARMNVTSAIKAIKIECNAYLQRELAFRQTESMKVNNGNTYTLYSTETNRNDMGIWLSGTSKLFRNGTLVGGIDFKSGSVEGSDIYKTATDIVNNRGDLDMTGVFCDYEYSLWEKKFIIDAGLRFDYAYFHKGYFHVDEASAATAFMNLFPNYLYPATWNAFSPKVAFKYNFNPRLNVYIAWNKGFRPPILDDICRNGNVSKGFKLANPFLNPEKIDNYEVGGDFSFYKIKLEASFYYSLGKDFMYFAATGDSVNTGGNKLKPILKRENIGNVSIDGAEISLSYPICKWVRFMANYAYTQSVITQYKVNTATDIDLKGKQLTDIPTHQVYAAVQLSSKIVHFTLNASYKSFTWADDANTLKNEGYWQVNTSLYREVFQHFMIRFNMIDVMDTPYTNNKGQISPGRYMTLSVSYKI
ncbi:MAG: TonB-dependent receptor [Bacteroidota bacterium]